jgi:hypothetical protein
LLSTLESHFDYEYLDQEFSFDKAAKAQPSPDVPLSFS